MPQKGWMRRIGTTLSVGMAAGLAVAAPAMATTIGNTTLPTSSNMGTACSSSTNAEIMQSAAASPYNYTVPAGGGSITSWSFNATNATAGTPYGLVVARPTGSTYQIIGEDSETVPSPVPSIATFNLAHPIPVQGGDVIGALVTVAKNTVYCRFKGGSLNSGDIVGAGLAATTIGTSFNFANTTGNELVNVSANVVQSNDVGVTQVSEPSSITQGDDGVFVLSATSTGPSATPVTVTDTLPAGLTLVSASAGTGTCTQSGQTVTCTVSGAPASIALVVSATAPGTYTNSVSAKGTILDPNSANDTASGTLTVKAATATPASTSVFGSTVDVGLAVHAGPIIL